MGKAAGIGIGIFVVILVMGGLFVYSYTQLSVELNDVQVHSIDWAALSWSTLVKLGLQTLTGDWLSAAFGLVQGINLNLIFALTNNGILPVYIPDLSYDILVNDISIGKGHSNVDMTINPAETKEIISFQNLQKSGLSPAVYSIVDSQGIMNIKVKGIAYFKLILIDIPIPFESSKQISVYDEIRDKLNAEIQKNNQKALVSSSVGKSLESALNSIVNELFGSNDLNLSLSGQTFIDSIYKIDPGTYTYVQFTLPCTSQVQGGFIANAVLGNNIIVYIFDDDNFSRFENDREGPAYYNSDKVESDVFDVTLSAGDYYIVMSNTYSSFSTKTVQLQASSLCV